MREILFRGKRKNGYDWIYGNYCGVECSLESGCGIECFIIEAPRDGSSVKVDAETVGQYTGLTDKNDQKIFEGDICRFREWSKGDMCWIGKVHYEYQQFVISGDKNKECETPFTLVMSRFIPENIEVIGNIYDNPELIET